MVKFGSDRITITLDREHLRFLFDAQDHLHNMLLLSNNNAKVPTFSKTIEWLLEIVDI